MANCNKCGQHVTFRFIDGTRVPIHSGGGWHCGSFSQATDLVRYTPRSVEWRNQDFTRPTRCPICGRDVFFVQHNRGSVWIDELGWPWPKHGCFDKQDEPTRYFSIWSAESSLLTNPELGIVTDVIGPANSPGCVIKLRLLTSSLVSLTLRSSPSKKAMLGSLVIISESDRCLLHRAYGRLQFEGFKHLGKANSKGYYKCPHCGAWVHEESGHDETCRSIPKDITKKDSEHRVHIQVGDHLFGSDRRSKTQPKSLAKTSMLEEQIQLALDSVAEKAWMSVTRVSPARLQFRQAKQEALRQIQMLPHSIKGQVERRFTADQWANLHKRRPN